MTDPITLKITTWEKIVERLRQGRVYFATGSQERNAGYVADFIECQLPGPSHAGEATIDFGDDWDAVLSVHQANY